SSTGRRRTGTPALRKYFWARMSQATWLQSAGTSMSFSWNTSEPSGLRISLVASRNSKSAYGSFPSVVKRRTMRMRQNPPVAAERRVDRDDEMELVDGQMSGGVGRNVINGRRLRLNPWR